MTTLPNTLRGRGLRGVEAAISLSTAIYPIRVVAAAVRGCQSGAGVKVHRGELTPTVRGRHAAAV